MPKPTPRKERLEDLVSLARTYHGWTQKQLADELGRDPHNIIPGGGIPRLDLVLRLSEALDWPLETVVSDLCETTVADLEPSDDTSSWLDLDRACYAAFNAGEVVEALALSRRSLRRASSSDERGFSYIRQCGAWDLLGRYQQELESARAGLRLPGLTFTVYADLKVHLANAHCMLGDLEEAEGVASSLLLQLGSSELSSSTRQRLVGYTIYVRACARRAQALALGTTVSIPAAQLALADFEAATKDLQEYARASRSSTHENLARTCEGAVVQLRALIGDLTFDEALAWFELHVPASTPDDQSADHALLESVGWWCIFASEIAVRSGLAPEQIDRLVAIFTNRADEISRLIRNWALRKHVWAIDYASRVEAGDVSLGEAVVDPEDLRDLAGTMGRFPAFRELGWKILRRAGKLHEE